MQSTHTSKATPEIEIRFDLPFDQRFFDELRPLILEKKIDPKTGNVVFHEV